MPRPPMKPPRTLFRGHALIRHGPCDWRCKCGEPMRSWRIHTARDGSMYRIDWPASDGAREAMRLHRARLWIAWNGS